MTLKDVSDELKAYNARVYDGDPSLSGIALIEALELVANQNVPLPYWLAQEVAFRIRSTLSPMRNARGDIHPASLHEAFGLEGALPSRRKKVGNNRVQRLQAEVLTEWVDTIQAMSMESTESAIKRALKIFKPRLTFQLSLAKKLVNRQRKLNSVHSSVRPAVRKHKIT